MADTSFPIGTIVSIFGADPNNPPEGWLPCIGGTFSSDQYEQLSILLGGTTLPNFAGMTLIGAGTNSANVAWPTSNTKGATNQNSDGTYGASTHQLSLAEIPPHQHNGVGDSTQNGWPYGFDSAGNNNRGLSGTDTDNGFYPSGWAGGQGTTASSPGTTNSFKLMQPSYALYFYIYAGTSDESTVSGKDVDHV
ncbi:tail fiber protein [Solimicrobium silvestre]|uniref:Phage Tail Collar Domain n=1 Tax=Solimicrobium silvestre TaxID=2099400 RepID=A0A2S9GTJ9_9BURK|nr:tail fiber protein [Solimicrobium silvestre]PRC91044.1 Phage Tail Collar Domain [Solimicrobium silvestre]